VKRVLAVGLFLVGFAAAGTFSAAVIADTGTTATTTDTSTTVATTTTTVTTVPSTTVPATVPPGVRVAGIRVGGLTRDDAAAAVQAAFDRPLDVVVGRLHLKLDPATVATAYVATAVARARIAAPGTRVRLVVAVNGSALRAWVAKAAQRVGSTPVDASLTSQNGLPVFTPSRDGRKLDAALLTEKLARVLHANTRLPVRARVRIVPAEVTAESIGPVILINRSINRLFLFKPTAKKLASWRTFAVATGQAIYPTPTGTFHIVVKWKNPWWYPPTQDAWAKGLLPVPPGPNNPLGTRWMGLSAPGVGIHGTDEPASIGYSASHGCIRMQVPDAEWLFDHVNVGTTVFIV
jgi:lipoprotein-anchoring transpeptidase ErfK/SrfK